MPPVTVARKGREGESLRRLWAAITLMTRRLTRRPRLSAARDQLAQAAWTGKTSPRSRSRSRPTWRPVSGPRLSVAQFRFPAGGHLTGRYLAVRPVTFRDHKVGIMLAPVSDEAVAASTHGSGLTGSVATRAPGRGAFVTAVGRMPGRRPPRPRGGRRGRFDRRRSSASWPGRAPVEPRVPGRLAGVP